MRNTCGAPHGTRYTYVQSPAKASCPGTYSTQQAGTHSTEAPGRPGYISKCPCPRRRACLALASHAGVASMASCARPPPWPCKIPTASPASMRLACSTLDHGEAGRPWPASTEACYAAPSAWHGATATHSSRAHSRWAPLASRPEAAQVQPRTTRGCAPPRQRRSQRRLTSR